VGAYGGKQEIMQWVAPSGPVYQAGTLSGNPVAMTAGIATLEILAEKGIYTDLEEKAKHLFEGLVDSAQKAMTPIYPTRIGSLLCLFFTNEKVINYTTAKKSNTTAFARFFSAMLEEGIYLPPSQFEALFLSTAHSHLDIEQTLKAARNAFKQL
jgi:glutamate-1-semialdehyde 2,1-aminomutase